MPGKKSEFRVCLYLTAHPSKTPFGGVAAAFSLGWGAWSPAPIKWVMGDEPASKKDTYDRVSKATKGGSKKTASVDQDDLFGVPRTHGMGARRTDFDLKRTLINGVTSEFCCLFPNAAAAPPCHLLRRNSMLRIKKIPLQSRCRCGVGTK